MTTLSCGSMYISVKLGAASAGDLPDGLIFRNHVKPFRQKYFSFSETRIRPMFRSVPHPLGGAYRDRHGRWARDAVDVDVPLDVGH
jgi:hypothetical protein